MNLPDASQPALPPGSFEILIAVAVLLMVWGLRVYVRGARLISREGGKVNSQPLDLPEAMFATLLAGFLVLLALQGFAMKSLPVTPQRLIGSAEFFGMIVLAVVATLKVRHHSLGELFGWRRLSFPRLVSRAVVYLLAAFPLVAVVNVGMAKLLGDRGDMQDIVKFFLSANQRHDYPAIAETIVLAAIVAPIFEEFIFRGFLYGVARRYLGMVPAIILVSTLFGAIHSNLAVLPGLTLLSVCFCLAYEATGSLFTSMIMHALFNLTSLLVMMLSMHALP
ncbi:MAG: CPBP family intramembrane metalloprotease [Chthoniobacteraceae bacterium]